MLKAKANSLQCIEQNQGRVESSVLRMRIEAIFSGSTYMQLKVMSERRKQAHLFAVDQKAKYYLSGSWHDDPCLFVVQ